MCFKEERVFTCGHIGWAYHTCTYHQFCNDNSIRQINDSRQCGIGGYYCRCDLDGARIDRIYEDFDTVKKIEQHISDRIVAMKDLHDRLQEHFKHSSALGSNRDLANAMRKTMENCLDLINRQQESDWQIAQFERMIDGAKQHYEVVIPQATAQYGFIPAFILPPLEPEPTPIKQLSPGTGTLVRGRSRPLPFDSNGRYKPSAPQRPAPSYNQTVQAPSQLHSFEPQIPFLIGTPIDSMTGDRTEFFRRLAQEELDRSHEQARLNGVEIPTSPVKARRVMQRAGPRPPRARKPRSAQNERDSPTPPPRRQLREKSVIDYTDEPEIEQSYGSIPLPGPASFRDRLGQIGMCFNQGMQQHFSGGFDHTQPGSVFDSDPIHAPVVEARAMDRIHQPTVATPRHAVNIGSNNSLDELDIDTWNGQSIIPAGVSNKRSSYSDQSGNNKRARLEHHG